MTAEERIKNIDFKGAVFDVDGTLLDSMSVWWEVLTDFFAEHGRALTDEEADSYKERTLEESIPEMIDLLGLNMTQSELSDLLKKKIFLEYKNTLPLKDGAARYMKKLHDRNIKIALATSGYEELCRGALTRLGVWRYVDACAFSSEVGVNKSNPDVYLLAAERIGIEPSECVVFEDITSGIEGAKKGGFITCALFDATNETETDKLKKLADCYITDWGKLL